MSLAIVDDIVRRHGAVESSLIPVLQDVQAELMWLAPTVLERVAERLDVPLIDVYGIATFYKSFRLKPRGKHLITVCLGTACHVRGAPRILDAFRRRLGIEPDETTPDRLFTLETVNCLGACALGPIAVVNGTYHGGMTTGKVEALIAGLAKDRAQTAEITQ